MKTFHYQAIACISVACSRLNTGGCTVEAYWLLSCSDCNDIFAAGQPALSMKKRSHRLVEPLFLTLLRQSADSGREQQSVLSHDQQSIETNQSYQ